MGRYYELNDTIRIGINIHNPSGGALIVADETPRWFVYQNDSDTPILQGDFTSRTGLPGVYRASFQASTGNGFSIEGYYEVHASGKVNNVVDRTIVDSFIINDIYDANVVRWSGAPVHTDQLNNNVYFANIKYVKDNVNNQDEISCQWYRNDQPLTSGELSNPAVSAHQTSNGTALFQNQTMNYASVNLGVVRYTDVSFSIPSGEPILISVSGTIDNSNKVWRQVVGLDLY